jgi:hypothetical protein
MVEPTPVGATRAAVVQGSGPTTIRERFSEVLARRAARRRKAKEDATYHSICPRHGVPLESGVEGIEPEGVFVVMCPICAASYRKAKAARLKREEGG